MASLPVSRPRWRARAAPSVRGDRGPDWPRLEPRIDPDSAHPGPQIRRGAPLIYGRDGKDYLVVASRGGSPEHPGWYKNVIAHPDVKIQVRDTVPTVTARTASAAEKKSLWLTMTAEWPDYDKYQAGTTRDLPVVVLSPR